MKKYVLAPALAALAMFVFGAIFWMSPLPYKALGRVTDDTAAADALAKIFPETGTYLIPGAYVDPKVMTALYERGPSAMIYFIKEGHPAMNPAVLIKGYLHYFVVALLLMMLLEKSAKAFTSYSCRVKSCTMVGVIAAVFLALGDTIWWYHPLGWHLMSALYYVLAFVLAGLVLAKFSQLAPADPAGMM